MATSWSIFEPTKPAANFNPGNIALRRAVAGGQMSSHLAALFTPERYRGPTRLEGAMTATAPWCETHDRRFRTPTNGEPRRCSHVAILSRL
jgi:hypothetical protein